MRLTWIAVLPAAVVSGWQEWWPAHLVAVPLAAQAERLGVVLISHNINDVMRVADNIACLYLGRLAAQVPASSMSNSQVVELITTGRTGDIGLRPEVAANSDAIDPSTGA